MLIIIRSLSIVLIYFKAGFQFGQCTQYRAVSRQYSSFCLAKRLHHSVKSASTLVFNIRKYHELKKWTNFFWKFIGDRDLSQNCRASWNYISIIQSFLCAAPSCKVSYNAHSQSIYIYTIRMYIYIYISTTVNYWSLITSPPLWPVFCLEIQTSGDDYIDS